MCTWLKDEVSSFAFHVSLRGLNGKESQILIFSTSFLKSPSVKAREEALRLESLLSVFPYILHTLFGLVSWHGC